MKKRITKVIIFLIIFCILFYIVNLILWLPLTSVSYFYKEPKNSLDIVYIGASNAYVHFNTVLAYNLYGYTTGMLSADAQPFVLTEYLIKESEKYQKPNLYIIDIAKIAGEPKDDPEGNIRKTIDAMKFSKNRIDAIDAMLSYEKIDKKEAINWYISFLMYHNKWKSPSKINILGNKNLYKGYKLSELVSSIEPQETYNWSENMLQLQKENKEILINLIKYIKSNNINTLFVVSKRIYDEQTNERINDAIKIIKDNNLNIINCNTMVEFNNIYFNEDFYNESHLNVYGATKYTIDLSNYLKENYELPDHRGDANYASWDSEYKRFKQDFKKITNKDYDELLEENM